MYTLGAFIDLSKTFDTVDRTILFEKPKLYGISGNNHNRIKSFLSNRQYYIEIDLTAKNSVEIVKLGVPQGSILAPLLFLLYVNDHKNASSLLDPIMFADNTNLFYTHKNIHCLFSDANKGLTNINEWFAANKFSLNVEKTKYSFFHKPSKKDNIPLHLPNLTTNNRKIKKEESITFLGVLLDENVTWKEHLKFIENKFPKNTGLLYKAKHHLNKKCLLSLYYFYVHTYINYANIAWGNTHFTNLKKRHSKQKHAIRIIYNKTKFEPIRHFFRKNKILNVHQLNILNVMFMHKISTKTAPSGLHSRFQRPSHSYFTNFSESNYPLPTSNLRKSKFRISIRGSLLWSNFLTKTKNSLETMPLFNSKVEFTGVRK